MNKVLRIKYWKGKVTKIRFIAYQIDMEWRDIEMDNL